MKLMDEIRAWPGVSSVGFVKIEEPHPEQVARVHLEIVWAADGASYVIEVPSKEGLRFVLEMYFAGS